MGGHRQRRVRVAPVIQAGQDPTDRYQTACLDLAESIGWEFEEVCRFWSQIALCRMHCGEPQPIAEYMALKNVAVALDTRGREPD